MPRLSVGWPFTIGPMPHQWGLFLAGSVVVTIVPGADMALITRQVVSRGRAAAQLTVFGNLTGLAVHATALAAGLSALLVASATAYTTIKLAGAAYLVYLGVQSLRHARRSIAAGRAPPKMTGNAYLQGLISTVLNPKPALFFLSYLPQFIDRDGSIVLQVAILAAVHIVIGLLWLSFYAWFVARLHDALTRPRVKAALESATGAIMIALGFRVALER
jgi:threonine/homoserine/homoserine lactone efflux protein